MSESPPLLGQVPSSPPGNSRARAQATAKKRIQTFKQVLGYLILAVIFPTAIWFSAKTGNRLAMKSLPANGQTQSQYPNGQTLTLGGANAPVYLADSPDDLRGFYLNFPDEESRSNATEFTAYGMRRIYSRIQMAILRYDADAVQVRVTSGSISGAIYWIHISLLQDIPSQAPSDAIIDPIPKR